MPNIKSAKKRVKVSETRALRNKMYRTGMKTVVKKYELAVATGDKEAAKVAYAAAIKKVDQAVAHGILHKNTASRRKSRFTKMLNAMN